MMPGPVTATPGMTPGRATGMPANCQKRAMIWLAHASYTLSVSVP
jgi:hypothetical protein